MAGSENNQRQLIESDVSLLKSRVRELEEKNRSLQSKLRQAQDARSGLSNHFQSIFRSAAAGIAVANPQGRFVEVNSAFCRIVGYSADELRDLTLQQVTHSTDLPECRRATLAMMHSPGEFREFDKRYIRKDGTVIWVQNSVAWIFDQNGKPLFRVTVVTDETQRKKMEAERSRIESRLQQSQKIESLGVMAGGVAHDFNNLLTAILGNVSLALEASEGRNDPKPLLMEVEKAAERAAEISRQMLNYAGRGALNPTSMDLSTLTRETISLLQPSIPGRITLEPLLSKTPHTVADSNQVRQVIINLVTNAIESIEGEKGLIRIITGARFYAEKKLSSSVIDDNLSGGNYIYIEISDSGCGIAEEKQKLIFDPFFTTKFMGRGLGLAATLGIVRGHKGAIQIDSKQERGTTVRVLLPTPGVNAKNSLE